MVDSAAIASDASIRCVILENNAPQDQEALHCNIHVTKSVEACQLLADTTGLAKGRIKDAMAKGAVWLKREGLKERRLRKAKYELKAGDFLQLFYDPKILSQTPPEPFCIEGNPDYSVWFKPPWLLSQGSRYGDHCSLLRIAEKTHRNLDYKLIHRLDREASGLLVIAHNSGAAHLLSVLFQDNLILKRYFAEVWGTPVLTESGIKLTQSLDAKDACTEILSCHQGETNKSSILDIRLHSGRLHQIRRHLADWGYSVLGDPKYGERRKQESNLPLRLCAWQLSFISPFDNTQKYYQVSHKFLPPFFKTVIDKVQKKPESMK